jgi:hypothetical protein
LKCAILDNQEYPFLVFTRKNMKNEKTNSEKKEIKLDEVIA